MTQSTNGVAGMAADYEEVLADHNRLVHELDVLLNGEAGAAKQASLCDIIAQVRREGIRSPHGVNTCSCGPKGHRHTNPLCPQNDAPGVGEVDRG